MADNTYYVNSESAGSCHLQLEDFVSFRRRLPFRQSGLQEHVAEFRERVPELIKTKRNR